jgi:hypothetical protein
MNKALGSLLAVIFSGLMVSAQAQTPFMFGVVNNTFTHTEHESLLIKSLSETDSADFPFVVVNGIKSSFESCSDGLYQQRRDLLNLSQTAIIVSLTGADWVGCHNKQGGAIATERLNHIREVFYVDAVSLGQYNIPLVRQSILPQFRSYPENTRWESHNIVFATINTPLPNNHWISDGGRNSEFEDRLIANKDWLQRVFLLATVKKSPAIVLFSDANFLTSGTQAQPLMQEVRDAFTGIRQSFQKLAASYKGRVLIVHNQPNDTNASTPNIQWDNNIGQVAIRSPWMAVNVDTHTPTMFTLHTLKDIPQAVPAPAVPNAEAVATP